MAIKDIKESIKNYFLVNPLSKLRVRPMERLLKLPLPSVIKYCKELIKEGILTTVKTGNVVFYTADRANYNFVLEKQLFNLRQIYTSGIIDYIRIELSNPTIILFGSYAKGEDTENSDIDLYIETSSKKIINLKQFEKNLQRKVQVFLHGNISEIKNNHLANSILNGIVLNGFVEVFK